MNENNRNIFFTNRLWIFLLSLFIVAIFMAISILFLGSNWESNDDVGMSMVAHGYGYIEYGSPKIIFSNVIWGYIIRAIPTVNGVLGYSIASILSLFISGFAILYFLFRIGINKYIASISVFLILIYPIVFLQFTINSGLLTVSALIGLYCYTRVGGVLLPFFILILAFLGYLIRSQEFFLVLAVGLPFISWKFFFHDRKLQIAFLCLVILIFGSESFDNYSYGNDNWQTFHENNAARAPFTDFGANTKLIARPDILKNYNYTINDIKLLRSWFFVDPTILNPKALESMLEELGFVSFIKSNIGSGINALKSLLSDRVLVLVIPIILLYLLMPSWRLSISIGIFLSTVFALGLLGRGGVLRVYVPLLSLGYIMALIYALSPTQKFSLRKLRYSQILAFLVSIIALFYSYYIIAPQSSMAKKNIKETYEQVSKFPDEMIVGWGSQPVIEYIYPPLGTNMVFRELNLYPMGVFTHAPFTVSFLSEFEGRGFIDSILSSGGILIAASDYNISLLEIWCKEKYSYSLTSEKILHFNSTKINRFRCVD